MKNFTILIFLLALLVSSCDEQVSVEAISTAPTISFKTPGSIIAGSTEPLTAVAKDGSITPLTEATLTLKSGTTVVFTEKKTASGLSILFTIPTATVSSLLPGSYKIEVVAKDNANQETKASKDLAVACDALASCKDKTKTTVILVAPSSTPAGAKIGLIGTLTGFSTDILMTKVSTNCYCAAVDFPNGTEFKFRRSLNGNSNPDWTYVEKGPTCNEVDNRKQGNAPDKTITLSVVNWRNTGACPD
jgi:hypothetical protein